MVPSSFIILLLHRVRYLIPPQSLNTRFPTGYFISHLLSTPIRFYLCKAKSLIFTAAFISLSWCSPHCGQIHSLSDSFNPVLIYPHLLQVLLLGSNLPINTTFLPYNYALYSSCLTNSLQAALCMELARW